MHIRNALCTQNINIMYTPKQVKELLRQQRELCAKSAEKLSQMGYYSKSVYDRVLNAPEPELPVVEPTSVENLIQKWEKDKRIYDNQIADERKRRNSPDLLYAERNVLISCLADLKALAVHPKKD